MGSTFVCAFSVKRNGLLTEARALSNPTPANSAGICYDLTMAKQKKPIAKGNKVGGFVVGRERFAKISAVEGIRLTEVMEKRAAEADRKGLTAEKYRQTIIRSYRKS